MFLCFMDPVGKLIWKILEVYKNRDIVSHIRQVDNLILFVSPVFQQSCASIWQVVAWNAAITACEAGLVYPVVTGWWPAPIGAPNVTLHLDMSEIQHRYPKIKKPHSKFGAWDTLSINHHSWYLILNFGCQSPGDQWERALLVLNSMTGLQPDTISSLSRAWNAAVCLLGITFKTLNHLSNLDGNS